MDLVSRAHVRQWMLFTVTALRKLTLTLFAPIFRPDIKISSAQKKNAASANAGALSVVEKQLSSNQWLAGGDGPSLADIAAYQEIGQCQNKFVDLLDFTSYPNIVAWMARWV